MKLDKLVILAPHDRNKCKVLSNEPCSFLNSTFLIPRICVPKISNCCVNLGQ